MNVEYNLGGIKVAGKFSVGKDNNNEPCLNLYYMWIKSGSVAPDDAMELLIKQALFEYGFGKPLPLNIKVNFWNCIQQINSNIPFYIGCSNECCTLEFEITNDFFTNMYAEVISRVSGTLPCLPSCIEVCSIFQSGGSFGIPKNTTETNENDVNFNSLRITPNPSDGIFDLSVNSQSSSLVTLKIFNLSGSEVFSTDLMTSEGSNIFNMNLSHLVNGSYYIYLINEDYHINKINFIKK